MTTTRGRGRKQFGSRGDSEGGDRGGFGGRGRGASRGRGSFGGIVFVCACVHVCVHVCACVFGGSGVTWLSCVCGAHLRMCVHIRRIYYS